MRLRILSARLVMAVTLALVTLTIACRASGRRERSADARARDDAEPAASYQAEVEEGLGAAVAILVDTSGSMRDDAPGDSRPKAVVAREALAAMFDATESLVAKRP